MATRRRGPALVGLGASAGGLEAVSTIVERLPADIPACVLVVVHTTAFSESRLPQILGRHSHLHPAHARDGDRIAAGLVLIAPPDRHLLVEGDRVRLSGGPRINGHRPAIDPLFKSMAAAGAGSRSIGVVLSGNLDDGSLGLLAIRQAGGMALVQDPEEAAFPGMPTAAIEVAMPQHVARMARLPRIITDIVMGGDGVPKRAAPPRDVTKAARAPGAAKHDHELIGVDDTPGSPTGLSCPECHGVLWLDASLGKDTFRCRIGHEYSPDSLFEQQGFFLEQALWAAIRALRERETTARSLATWAEEQGHEGVDRRYESRANQARAYAEEIEKLLLRQSW